MAVRIYNMRTKDLAPSTTGHWKYIYVGKVNSMYFCADGSNEREGRKSDADQTEQRHEHVGVAFLACASEVKLRV